MERALEARDRSESQRFIDVRFADFVEDSMSVIQKVYDHFELPLGDAAEQAMRDHVSSNPKGKHGSHDYDLERYGLTTQQVRDRLAGYIDRFGP